MGRRIVQSRWVSIAVGNFERLSPDNSRENSGERTAFSMRENGFLSEKGRLSFKVRTAVCPSGAGLDTIFQVLEKKVAKNFVSSKKVRTFAPAKRKTLHP